MKTETDALQRAIDYLGAVELGTDLADQDDDPETGMTTTWTVTRYAYRIEKLGRWFVTDGDTLQERAFQADIFTAEPGVLMPAWWTPDGAQTVCGRCHQLALCQCEGRPALVTVNLETGEEVPA